MREIKFRGKRVDNGEWIYGDLMTYDNDYVICDVDDGGYLPIVRETVGQFTGLLDKNGKEIYEGDIVMEGMNKYTPIYQNAIYMAYNVDKINNPYVSTQFNVIWRNGCEVIGNINDNLELLKEKQ